MKQDIFDMKGTLLIVNRIKMLEKQVNNLNDILDKGNDTVDIPHYRKLVKHGPSTLITSLPSKWIKKNNLNSGDTIKIIEVNNKLIISK